MRKIKVGLLTMSDGREHLNRDYAPITMKYQREIIDALQASGRYEVVAGSGPICSNDMARQEAQRLRREGVDVFCDAPITFAQAVLGATLEIPTIDGKVQYTVPEGTQSGTVFRLRGKGIQYLNGRGRG